MVFLCVLSLVCVMATCLNVDALMREDNRAVQPMSPLFIRGGSTVDGGSDFPPLLNETRAMMKGEFKS
jgi:hypothetical protein